MALPKRRQSKARGRKRRAHDALTPPVYINCPQCGADTIPHAVCTECGSYRGKSLLKVKAKKEKKKTDEQSE